LQTFLHQLRCHIEGRSKLGLVLSTALGGLWPTTAASAKTLTNGARDLARV
jgi:hypothetical protein